MELVNFDSNSRVNPVLENPKPVTEYRAERVLTAALPILQMVAPARNVVTLLSGIQLAVPLTKSVLAGYLSIDKTEMKKSLAQMALITMTIAGTVLFPIPTAIASYTYQFGVDLASLVQHVKEEKYAEAAQDLFKLINHAAFAGSILLGGPELILLSLVLQAGKELYQAKGEFTKGRHIEAGAKVLTALIRLYAAHPHLVATNRDWFGKEVSQKDLGIVFQEAARRQAEKPDQLVDINQILADKGFKRRFTNLKFDQEMHSLLFQDLRFKDCEIKSKIDNTKFVSTLFEATLFKDAIGKDVTFDKCRFHFSEFANSKMIGFNITQSEFLNSAIRFSNFSKGEWTNSTMTNLSVDNCQFDADRFDANEWSESSIGATIFSKITFSNSVHRDLKFGTNQFSNKTKFKDVRFEESEMIRNQFDEVEIDELTFANTLPVDTKFVGGKIQSLSFE